MNEALHAVRGRSLRDQLRAARLGGSEFLAAFLKQDADQVYHAPRALDRPLHGGAVAHIGLEQLDLTRFPGDFQVLRRMRVAHRYAHAEALLAQLANDIAADKAGPAKDGDDFRTQGHGSSVSVMRAGPACLAQSAASSGLSSWRGGP